MTSPMNFDVTRRELLRRGGLVTVGLAVTPVAGCLIRLGSKA